MWNKENKSNQNINLIKWTTPEIIELNLLHTEGEDAGGDDGVGAGVLSG